MTKTKNAKKICDNTEVQFISNEPLLTPPDALETIPGLELSENNKEKYLPASKSYIKNREMETSYNEPYSFLESSVISVEKELYKLAQYNPCMRYADTYFTDESVDCITKEANLDGYNAAINKLLDIKNVGNDKPTALLYKFVPIYINILRGYADTKDSISIMYGRIITILLSYILKEKSEEDIIDYFRKFRGCMSKDMSRIINSVIEYYEKIAWNFDKDRTPFTTAPFVYSDMCDIQYLSSLDLLISEFTNPEEYAFGKAMSDIHHLIQESKYLDQHVK